jgi:hypothetical protein
MRTMWYIIIAVLGFGGGYFAHTRPTVEDNILNNTDTIKSLSMQIEAKTDTIKDMTQRLSKKIDTIYLEAIPKIIFKQDTIIYMTGEVLQIVKNIDTKTDTLIKRYKMK